MDQPDHTTVQTKTMGVAGETTTVERQRESPLLLGESRARVLRLIGPILVSAIPILSLFVLWEIVARAEVFHASLLTPPTIVLVVVWDMFVSGDILPHLGASLKRGGSGLAIAIGAGVPLGLFIGSVKIVSRAMSPVIEFLRQLPPLAMLPVFLLFLGLGLRSQVAIVIWAALWPVLLNTITGARGVDERLVKAARTLGASRFDVFLKVALPSALPMTMTGVRLGASYAFLVLVAAEMVGASSGLGFLVLNFQYTYRIPEMFAAILILAAFGVALNYGLLLLERKLTPWTGHV